VSKREWLRRELGTIDMYSLVHADFQSTFYLTLGFIALYSGREAFFIVIYAVALMIAIAIAYGEIGSRFPEAGGSFLYAKHAIGGGLGFLSSWLLMIDQAIMVSYGTLDASNYVLTYLGVSHIPPQILAIALSLMLYILTLIGIRESAKVALGIVIIDFTVIGALLISFNIIAGTVAEPPHYRWEGVEPMDLLVALSLASRGFTGVDAIGQLAGEARKPLVQVPRAAFLTATIGVLYSLPLTAILMSRISYEELVEEPSLALLLIARETPYISWFVEPLVVLNIAVIMLIASLAGYISFSRLAYILSHENLVPEPMVRLHPRFRTPYISLTIVLIISLLFILPGEISFILEVYAIGSLFNYLVVSISLLMISRKGELYGGFTSPRVRGIPLTALFGIPLTFVGLVFNIIVKWSFLWILGLWLLLGLIIYMRRRESKGFRLHSG